MSNDSATETPLKSNGAAAHAEPAAPLEVSASAERGSLEPSIAGPYNIRDLIFLAEHEIGPGERHTIVVKPRDDERVLLGRIFLHKTCCDNLILRRFAVGERTIAQGAGTAEMFLATIPNWTPQNLHVDKENPLILMVLNPRHFPIRIAGSVVVFRR